MDSRHWELCVERRPFTINSVYGRLHLHQRAALVKEWREAFGWEARRARIPKLDAVMVVAKPEVKDRRSLPDTGACVGAAKAGIDALVDVNVLVDDGPDVVRRLVFDAPRVTGRDALVLTVVEWPVGAVA